jgi:EmrB/QacA subfamily drug resistance transporter
LKLKMEYKWEALTITALGTFMSTMDMSIVVIGLPTILGDLQASLIHGIWIISGYVLMMTIFLVILGRLGDLYGKVRLYNLGFGVFTLGSLLCALSQSGEQLIIFRFLQGAGAAMLTVNSIAIITDAFPRQELGKALGTNVIGYNLGAIAGYTLSGVMIHYFGWRSIFLMNVPIGILATLWGYKRLKEIGVKPVGEKFDYAGSILYCIGLTIILLGLTIGNPASSRNIAIIIGGVIFFICVIFVELRQKYPTLDLKLFKIRLFAAGNIAGFLNSIAFSCGPFLLSLYLQLVLGYSAFKAGVILIPMEIAVVVFSMISGRLSDRYGGQVLCSIGLALNASAFICFSRLHENSWYGEILVGLILFGIGRALFAPPNISSIMSSVLPEKRGVANGIRTTLTQTANVLSVPFSLLLMTMVFPYDKLSQIIGVSQLIDPNDAPMFLKALKLAFFILGIITLSAVIPSILRGPRQKTAAQKPKS